MKLLTLVTAALCAFSFSCYSEEIELSYSSFYSHTKKLDDENMQALRFAFGFRHVVSQQACQIESALIYTQKQQEPLEISSEQRFVLPSDKILKLAEAKVRIVLGEQANRCDLSVQLETKPEYLKTAYSQQDLLELLANFEEFFSEMGGILSFMMPKAEGLILHFSAGEGVSTNPKIGIQEQTATLTEGWISSHQTLQLTHKPKRITALLSR